MIDRWMRFEGLDNVRDVGGLPLRDGGSTRSGVLLRSAALHWATPADVRRLVDEFGLRLVLDLRTPREIDRDGPTPVATAGVETVALNFIGASRELPETGDDTDPLLRNYLGYLDDQPANIVEAVRRLAAPDAGPALVHCAAGKDRTGVLVAIVLEVAGVERAAVVEDYAAVERADRGAVPPVDDRVGRADARGGRPATAPPARRGDGGGARPPRHRARRGGGLADRARP